jgi:ligand-binding sensor domain-containing protein
LSNPCVQCIYQDRQGYLWIGTEAGGVNIFDRKKGEFVYLFDYGPFKNLKGKNAKALKYESGSGRDAVKYTSFLN